MGFFRAFSTAMREEKVRTLRALGPVRVSAAETARGWMIVFSSWDDSAFMGAASRAQTFWSLPGNFLEGKGSFGTASAPVSAASSF